MYQISNAKIRFICNRIKKEKEFNSKGFGWKNYMYQIKRSANGNVVLVCLMSYYSYQ